MSTISMQVIKRNGSKEDVSFDKVLNRIRIAADGLEVNSTLIAQRTLLRIYDGVKTTELDELAAQLSVSLMTTNPDYGTLASRIAISNHHRNTSDKFTEVIQALANQVVPKTGEKTTNISKELVEICEKYGEQIDAKIDYNRDYLLDYFGFKTLEKLQYLLRDTSGKTLERPQQLFMRVSLALWGSVDLDKAFETYDLLSQKYFIHATPTNFNAGTPRQQLSSCFLIAMKEDSIVGIYDTLKECAQISKNAGGIGLHIHNIRAKGALIKGTNGVSNGIVPMLRNFNDTARYVDQGGQKRNGSFAIYLEPWHADVEDFLKLKLNTGSEEERCRDLFYGLWIPDLFMERVEKNEPWTLFCPSEAPGLADVYGDKFKVLYEKYEQEGRGRKQIDAQKLWFKILDSQIETGTPYLLYKDASNKKSNQSNLGTIKSSNLCVAPETYILTDKGQQQISELEGKEVNVWNGDKWSKTTVMKTGENQHLMLVVILLENNERGKWVQNIYCTPYHKFILPDGSRVDAQNLSLSDELISWVDEKGVRTIQKVIHIKKDVRTADTYCFNEPENHAGVFNGILTGNCTEIIEYSSADETAVCNLASIALPMYVDAKKKTFNFEKLREVVKVAIRNLNRVIDINYYPTPETERSNMRHRPVGLGVQGLADVFAMMRMPWESEKAADLNQRIFEHIYYAAVESSAEIAEKEGTYSTYKGSPMSQGKFQYDLWGVQPITEEDGSLNWVALKEKVAKWGVRNSLLVAPMPTASTSQILGFNECLTGDSLVSLPNGLCKRLDKFTNKLENIITYNENTHGAEYGTQYEFIDKGLKSIREITLLDGRTIKCTDEHKILTQNDGWKCAKDIVNDDIILLTPIGTEDIIYSDENEWSLVLPKYTFHLKDTSERNKALAFSRILGYIRTDGSIQANNKITAVFGTERDANDFVADCMLIIPGLEYYKYYTTHNGCIEVVINGELRNIILSVPGMPHGTRVSQECGWPEFITNYNCPRAILREFIAGLFGGDGHSPSLIKTGNTYTFSRINFSQSCCPKNKEYLTNSLNTLCELLQKLDILDAKISSIRTYYPVNNSTFRCGDIEHTSIKISLPMRTSTFDKFMTNIGIRYCSHKLYRFEIAASWARYIKNVLYQYNTILQNAYIKSQNNLNVGWKYSKALKESINEFEKTHTILNNHYSRPSISLFYDYIKRINKQEEIKITYESLQFKYIINAKQFLEMTNTSHMFNDTTHTKLSNTYATSLTGQLPVYNMTIINNKAIHLQENVYDINVNNTHTFIANGIVVHNCIEPVTSNIYTRRTLAGEFIVINKHLMKDLQTYDIWNDEMKQMIIARNGSIQGIDIIPESLQKLYKTSWEIKQKTLIDMAAKRGAFICQSQSLNLFVADPNYAKLTSMHFYAWKLGLKTGIYYLRTRAPVMAQKFTVDPELQKAAEKSEQERIQKKYAPDEGCTMCSA